MLKNDNKTKRQNQIVNKTTPEEVSFDQEKPNDIALNAEATDKREEEEMSSDGFQEVKSKRQKHQNKKNETAQSSGNGNSDKTNPKKNGVKKPKPQFGERENENDDFRAGGSANKRIWLFISKVNEGVSEETIKKYIAKNTNKFNPSHLSV